MTKLEMRCWRAVINALFHLIQEMLDIKALIRNPNLRVTWATGAADCFSELSGLSGNLSDEIGDR